MMRIRIFDNLRLFHHGVTLLVELQFCDFVVRRELLCLLPRGLGQIVEPSFHQVVGLAKHKSIEQSAAKNKISYACSVVACSVCCT
jgi:hypothetical protein